MYFPGITPPEFCSNINVSSISKIIFEQISNCVFEDLTIIPDPSDFG